MVAGVFIMQNKIGGGGGLLMIKNWFIKENEIGGSREEGNFLKLVKMPYNRIFLSLNSRNAEGKNGSQKW